MLLGPGNFGVATEVLVVVSQCSFFIFLFLIVKHAAIDRRGLMGDRNALFSNACQICGIHLLTFGAITLLMLPLMEFEHALYVVIASLLSMGMIVVYDCRNALRTSNASSARGGGFEGWGLVEGGF